MMTYQQNADARETYRETAGVSVSRLASAAQGRESYEAVGGMTVTPAAYTVLSPMLTFGAVVHVPDFEVAATSEVVGDLNFVQTIGLNCAAKSARTSLV